MGSTSSAVWRRGTWGASVPELRELLNDNDPSARAEALVALGNLAGKGAPPAELKSLSAHGVMPAALANIEPRA
jgi:HEAT repeat protein